MPVPFANSEELHEAWHLALDHRLRQAAARPVETLLRGNPFFLERVFISDDRLFFGPALWSCSSRKPRGWRHPSATLVGCQPPPLSSGSTGLCGGASSHRLPAGMEA